MKKSILFSTSVISAALLVLSGCANYNASSLNSLGYELATTPSKGDTEGVQVAAKAFDKSDYKKYLDRDVIAKGYQPVQIYIQNDSEKNYIFALDRISLAVAKPEEVAPKVHTSTVGRAAAYGAGSLILWPLIIPAVVDGVKSANANEALDNDFSAKTASNIVLAPHSHYNKLIFVPLNEYQSNFTITLVEQGTGQAKVMDVNAS